ncbi:hypothetical protein G5I_01465 [Acromyrmex echinatior]|uniref:Uncharacterized protein n=1 Tax=Acromyrmex echinatior TaxID=103372 RepID=F4W7P9_ACREC|nr:hypothetical protein G5I_01465 [Acromyrmex echinatior]
MRTDEELRRTSVASFSMQTLTHLVNIPSLLVEILPHFERQQQFMSAMISQGDLHNVKTNMLLQFFSVSYDVLLSLANLSMLILYDLYFDGIDDVGDEHVGDFDAFSPGYSQYLAFSFEGGGLGGLGDNGQFQVFVNYKVSMHMRSRSSSKSKFHSHVRFSRPLTFTIACIIFKYSCCDQTFHLVVRDHPVLLSQSMVISSQPGSARPVGSCQKFPWHGTRKNVMCENDPLFQHRHFLHDKFLVNDESLQIHERWHEHVVEKTAVDCDVS